MMAKVEQARQHCETVTGRHLELGTVLADNGYLSDQNVTAPGPDRLIAPRGGLSKKNRDPDAPASAAATVMLKKLEQPGNKALYKRRSAIVEPVNGHLKDRRGLRRFARRGLDAARAELLMACLTTNLMKLFTARQLAVATS